MVNATSDYTSYYTNVLSHVPFPSRLLRLAGLQWRYSISPPHWTLDQIQSQNQLSLLNSRLVHNSCWPLLCSYCMNRTENIVSNSFSYCSVNPFLLLWFVCCCLATSYIYRRLCSNGSLLVSLLEQTCYNVILLQSFLIRIDMIHFCHQQ
jgi:hypothetical protein